MSKITEYSNLSSTPNVLVFCLLHIFIQLVLIMMHFTWQVFSSVKIHFSLDGKTFSPHTVSFCPKKDLKNDTVILVS